MQRIYADYNATSPSTRDHWQQVMEIVIGADANSSSIHQEGRQAKAVVEKARKQIAELLGASARSIIFTSGASESNNWIIQTICRTTDKPKNVVYTDSEHASVYKPIETLKQAGLCSAFSAKLKSSGKIDDSHLLSLISPQTDLVCLIHVHNELGCINPVEDIAKHIKKISPATHIHVDAVQSLGKVDLSWLGNSCVDTASFSAHKVGGFKGIGCLYKKEAAILDPFCIGGSQEFGLRAGTLFVAGAVSFGLCAAHIKKNPNWLDVAHHQGELLRNGLKNLPNVRLHSDPEGVATTVSFHIEGVGVDELMLNLDLAGISVSSGTACSSGNPKPSRTLQALGLSDWAASNSIRVSFGVGSSAKDASYILKVIEQVIERARP